MTTKHFQKIIWEFYKTNKRTFPWRATKDPYEIMVSELMLQQTQTQRVVPKYLTWLQYFPTIAALAEAKLPLVLENWSGLGYNRRAKFLWETAKFVTRMHKGKVPHTYEKLRELPGIGDYTASAILAFTYNEPTVVIETNIRTVIIHHYFADRDKVSDKEIKSVVEKTLDKKDPRQWYYALMDYGNFLKSEGFKYVSKQKNYTKQKPFKGSARFVRGYIIRELVKNGNLDINTVIIPGYEKETIESIANSLVTEQLIERDVNKPTLFTLPTK